jgi:hypothetical protein
VVGYPVRLGRIGAETSTWPNEVDWAIAPSYWRPDVAVDVSDGRLGAEVLTEQPAPSASTTNESLRMETSEIGKREQPPCRTSQNACRRRESP